jgi:hypothetical protein
MSFEVIGTYDVMCDKHKAAETITPQTLQATRNCYDWKINTLGHAAVREYYEVLSVSTEIVVILQVRMFTNRRSLVADVPLAFSGTLMNFKVLLRDPIGFWHREHAHQARR